jgi:hypothetical protein
MNKNVGETERWIRIGAGSGLILWGLAKRGWLRQTALTAGVSLIGTGVAQRCLINKLFEPKIFSQEPRLASEKPLVDETSEESFPASDAPSWAAGRAN